VSDNVRTKGELIYVLPLSEDKIQRLEIFAVLLQKKLLSAATRGSAGYLSFAVAHVSNSSIARVNPLSA
jgi:hypothetical protein